jgi:hypothetical protein
MTLGAGYRTPATAWNGLHPDGLAAIYGDNREGLRRSSTSTDSPRMLAAGPENG